RGRRSRPSIRQRRDDRRVIRRLLALALVAVDLDGEAARSERGRQQDVVDPEPPAAVKSTGAVIPPGEETALLAVAPERGPAPPRAEPPDGGAPPRRAGLPAARPRLQTRVRAETP